MTPKERELLQGMGNCYDVCHSDFEETVRMVGNRRSLTSEEVKAILKRIKEASGHTDEYKELRSRVPSDFPF